MIDVAIELRHEGEVRLFAEFTQILRTNREIEQSGVRPQASAETPQPAAPVEAPVAAPVAATREAPVVGAITIDDATLLAAFQKFAAQTTMPALIALLAEFDAKKIGEIKQERRAEFLDRVVVK